MKDISLNIITYKLASDVPNIHHINQFGSTRRFTVVSRVLSNRVTVDRLYAITNGSVWM